MPTNLGYVPKLRGKGTTFPQSGKGFGLKKLLLALHDTGERLIFAIRINEYDYGDFSKKRLSTPYNSSA